MEAVSNTHNLFWVWLCCVEEMAEDSVEKELGIRRKALNTQYLSFKGLCISVFYVLAVGGTCSMLHPSYRLLFLKFSCDHLLLFFTITTNSFNQSAYFLSRIRLNKKNYYFSKFLPFKFLINNQIYTLYFFNLFSVIVLNFLHINTINNFFMKLFIFCVSTCNYLFHLSIFPCDKLIILTK
jgi:hypothetical protein